MRRTAVVIGILILMATVVTAQKCPLYTTEGELLDLHIEGYDPDPEIGPAGRLIWLYPTPFDELGRWQTRVGDAGVYHFTFALSDGEFTDTYKSCLEVFPLYTPNPSVKKVKEHNNPPMLFGTKDIRMYVGDTLNIHISCMDIDGDDVEITYYGYPGQLVHTATVSEAGTHFAEVVCSDSRGAETRQAMTINVVGRSSVPTIPYDHLIAYEGDAIDITQGVDDMDDERDELRFKATGPFSASLVWYTQQGDAGNYTTRLSVSDGQNLAEKDILVEIRRRPAVEFAVDGCGERKGLMEIRIPGRNVCVNDTVEEFEYAEKIPCDENDTMVVQFGDLPCETPREKAGSTVIDVAGPPAAEKTEFDVVMLNTSEQISEKAPCELAKPTPIEVVMLDTSEALAEKNPCAQKPETQDASEQINPDRPASDVSVKTQVKSCPQIRPLPFTPAESPLTSWSAQ